MKRRICFILTLVAMIALGGVSLAQTSSSDDSGEFKVIVNAANPVSTLSRSAVADLFLKNVTRWANDRVVQPVDQGERLAVRQTFSLQILRKPISAVKTYWQQMLFSGRSVPPHEKASDQEVLDYVKANPNAIGYVSGSASVDGVKVVKISD